MNVLVAKFKKNGTADLLKKVEKLTGEEKAACIEVLIERGQDVTKWQPAEEKETPKTSGKVVEFEDETPLTAAEKKLLKQAEKEIKPETKKPENPQKEEKPAAEKPATIVWPEGFEKGTEVTFAASKRSPVPGEILTGKIKRYFWDTQGEVFYFAIDVAGKEYCKMPNAVTKIDNAK